MLTQWLDIGKIDQQLGCSLSTNDGSSEATGGMEGVPQPPRLPFLFIAELFSLQ